MTVEAWLRHWADNIVGARDLSEWYRLDYRYQVDQYLIPRLGRHRLSKLTVEHVERMMTTMRERRWVGTADHRLCPYRPPDGSGRLPSSAGRWRANVVTQTAAPKKTGTRLDDALDADDAAKVIVAAEGDRLEALAVLVLRYRPTARGSAPLGLVGYRPRRGDGNRPQSQDAIGSPHHRAPGFGGRGSADP